MQVRVKPPSPGGAKEPTLRRFYAGMPMWQTEKNSITSPSLAMISFAPYGAWAGWGADSPHGLRHGLPISLRSAGYDSEQAGSKKFLTSYYGWTIIDLSTGILPALCASRILPLREDKIPRGRTAGINLNWRRASARPVPTTPLRSW